MNTGREISLYPESGDQSLKKTLYTIDEDGVVSKETGAIPGTTVAHSGAGAIPITADTVLLTTTGANALTLADGRVNQKLTIVMVTDGGDGTLTPANFADGTTATFNTVGDILDLIFIAGEWHIITNKGVTVA